MPEPKLSDAALQRLQKSARVPARDRALCRADIQTGEGGDITFRGINKKQKPKALKDQLLLAWEHYEGNWFVREIVDRKLDFFNHDFTIKINGRLPQGKNKQALQGAADQLERWVEMVWRDYLVYSNAVSIYREDSPYPFPYTLPPWRCKYSDALGNEILKVELGFDKSQLDKRDMERFAGANEVKIGSESGEFFKVYSSGVFGYGFGKPSLYSVFDCLGQCSSMEVGEALVGFLCRTPIRQHLLGHEIKSGPLAGQPMHFWEEIRAKGIEKFFKGKVGFTEITTNFDHKIQYVWVPKEFFDDKKWATVINRLVWWAGPLGMMYLAKAINPFLMPLFKQEAIKARERVGRHIAAMLKHFLDVKESDVISVSWSNRPFHDQRLAYDMMKFGVSQGFMSLTTATEESGQDPEREGSRKEAEAAEPKKWLPLYDSAHGNAPGGERAGRKRGSGDNKEA